MTGSNILAWISHGTVMVSVLMTFASTAVAFASVPLFLFIGQEVFNAGAPEDERLAAPFTNVMLTLALLTIAFAGGVLVQRRRGLAHSEGWGRRLMQLGLLFAVLAGVTLLVDPVTRTYITHGSGAAYGTAFAMNAFGLLVGYALAVCARLPVQVSAEHLPEPDCNESVAFAQSYGLDAHCR